MVPYTILGLIIVSFILNNIISISVTKSSKEAKPSLLTGDDIAKRILGMNHIKDVKVEASSEEGENVYHPVHKTITLGPEVYGVKTIYALTIGSHEACHAVEYNYFRFLLLLVNKFKMFVFIPTFIASFFIHVSLLHSCVLWAYVGLILFTLFVVTFDELATNRRAYKALQQFTAVSKEEIKEVRKVQRKMNLTYITAIPSLM